MSFTDLSQKRDQEWLSDGFSEEIINLLANQNELAVTSRTSSFFFKDKEFAIAEIAKILGVDHIVEGTVLKVDDRLKITVRLIQTSNDNYLWSESYEGSVSDIFKFQNDIAEKVASKVLNEFSFKVKSIEQPERPSSFEAYENYLLGVRAHLDRYAQSRSQIDFDEAEKFFLNAISIDPKYSLSYAGLADLYDTRANYPPNQEIYWRRRDRIARKSISLNPVSINSLEVMALGFSKSQVPNLDSAFHYFKMAYTINPDDSYLNFLLGAFYFQIGLYDHGNQHLLKSLELDPLNHTARGNIANGLTFIGDLEGAEKAIALSERYHMLGAQGLSAINNIFKRDLKKAEIEINSIERKGEVVLPIVKAWLLAARGDKKGALKISKHILVYILLGMKEESLKELDSISLRTIPYVGGKASNLIVSLESLDKNPVWDFVRDEPEFKLTRNRIAQRRQERLLKYGTLD